jgi:hypothetical protein
MLEGQGCALNRSTTAIPQGGCNKMKRTIGLVTAVALSGAAYAQDVKVSGYADGGWSWTKAAGADATHGVGWNDGAIALGGTSGGSFGNLELKFIDTAAVIAGTNTISLFQPMITQANAGFKYDNGFWWKVGAFSGFLGAEDNNSNKRYFASEGRVSSKFFNYYKGIALGYSVSDSLTLEVAYANDMVGTTPGKVMDSPLMAVKLSTKMDDVNAYAGAEFFKANDESGYNVDVGAHAKMGEMHLGAEVGMSKAATAGADSGFAFGAHVGYDLMEGTQLLARFDWANENYNDGYDLTVGPSFKMSDALTTRVHYTMSKNGAADAGHNIAVQGVYNF